MESWGMVWKWLLCRWKSSWRSGLPSFNLLLFFLQVFFFVSPAHSWLSLESFHLAVSCSMFYCLFSIIYIFLLAEVPYYLEWDHVFTFRFNFPKQLNVCLLGFLSTVQGWYLPCRPFPLGASVMKTALFLRFLTFVFLSLFNFFSSLVI